MHITINVTDVDLDSVLETQHTEEDGPQDYTVRDAVIDEIARKMIVDRLGSEFTYELANRIRDIRNEMIREMLQPIIAEAIDQSVQPTNRFGEPSGAPSSMRDLIMAEVRSLVGTKTDYGRGPTVVQKIVGDEVRKVVDTEMRKAVQEEAVKAKAIVRERAAEFLAEQAAKR